jgi:hypothetical protein
MVGNLISLASFWAETSTISSMAITVRLSFFICFSGLMNHGISGSKFIDFMESSQRNR